MNEGSSHHGRPARRWLTDILVGWPRRWRNQPGLRSRRQLQREVQWLRRRLAELRQDHAALTERNASVEALSAELMRFNIDLSQVSRLDAMTGLLNRAAFEACLTQEHTLAVHARATGKRRPYSLIMVDVDHFKAFNDSLGHPAGDACLVAVAQALQGTVRRDDFVGRYGGEEVIILCPSLDAADAKLLAERLRQAVRDLRIAHPASPVAPMVTVSVGLATGDGRSDGPHGWTDTLHHADRMLYEAKHAGRDRVAAA